jgi:cbb3-type cytochrome c oxidase subunit III
MDALVAYLQKMGRDLKEFQKKDLALVQTAEAAEAKNPYTGNKKAEEEGEAVFKANCRSCHGEKGQGGFGPNLAGERWKYGGTDAALFATISGGRPGGMPAFEAQLGRDRTWKVIAYLRSLGKR